VVGANNAGKTNFLQAFVDSGTWLSQVFKIPLPPHPQQWIGLPTHLNHAGQPSSITFQYNGSLQEISRRSASHGGAGSVELFRLNPDVIAVREPVVAQAIIWPDGRGTTQVLESLKNGDQEELFDEAEKALRTYVPEIIKLSFVTPQQGQKEIQVREHGIQQPIVASQLSEGTRLIIALLAIIYQPIKPPVILLEDIDRAMHPRLFEQIVKLMDQIARDHQFHIVATTHNPYLVDCFQENPKAVVIVEKIEGESKLSTLEDKLQKLDYDKTDPSEVPLGNLWFSGFVGGVPEFLRRKQK
jgi:AAA domain, putative AbiEii toxin, Type IV TA system